MTNKQMDNSKIIDNNAINSTCFCPNLQNLPMPHAGIVVLNDMIHLIQQYQQTPEYQKNVYAYHNLKLEDEHIVDLFAKLLVNLQLLRLKLQQFELHIEHPVNKYNSEIYYIVQNIKSKYLTLDQARIYNFNKYP